jgi:hypothetical protein
MTSPEAEPKEKKKPAEQEAPAGEKEKEKKKDKKEGGDGASTPTVTPEMRKKIIDEYLKEQEAENKEENGENGNGEGPEVSATLWRTSREAVREPLGKVFKYGAIAAAPIPALGIWGLDKIARNTISKIPVVGNVYEIPRSIITSTATEVRDLLAGTITLPALPLDVAGNVIQGLTGKAKTEEKGFVGRLTESIATRVGKVGHWSLDKLKFAGGKLLDAAKWTLDSILKMAAAIFSIPFKATHAALDGVLKGGWSALSNPVSLVASVGTAALVTYGLAWTTGTTGAWWLIVNQLGAFLKTIPGLIGLG